MNKYITILMIILFANSSFSQNNNYAKLWQEVEGFEIDGLPKSALERVAEIETKAKAENNTSQIIKVMLFKSKFALILEEDAQLKIVNDFKAEIAKSSTPTKNVLENVLATLYWQYYQQNRYKFYNRTKTNEKVDATDFRTWDLQTLFDEIHLYYNNSLNNGLILQQTDLKNYNVLLTQQKNSKIYRPSLYDFLAHNALAFYSTKERNITKPAYKFEIDNPEFLAKAETFTSLAINSKDTTSLELNALHIYQDLIKFHLKDKNPFALTDANIKRLQFVHQNAIFSNKEALLLDAFKAESKKHATHEVSALYDFEIASIYNNQAGGYHFKDNPNVQWKFKEAITICDAVIAKFPDSKGAKKCTVLKSRILNPSLNIKSEAYLPIQTNARLLLNYKNIESLNLKAFKLSEKQYEKFTILYKQEEKTAFIKKLDPTTQWEASLKNENDYQQHSMEILFPKLDSGRFLVTAETTNLESNFTASTIVQITDNAVIEYDDSDKKHFQFINRNNGKPIANAKIEITYFYSNEIVETINTTADSKGKIAIKKSKGNNRNLKLKITNKNDIGYFGNYYINNYYRNRNNNSKASYNAFLFTDRSIYRPGQTVYFKAIALKRENEKSDVLEDKKVTVTFYNTNHEEVKKLDLKTNAYGSVASEFIIPNDGLTGVSSIRIKGDNRLNGYTSFSIEEYKRPKFETNFKPITETIKVNDSVTVKGEAMAFAGSSITDAKVMYRVKRNVQYPRWYYWSRGNSFSSEAQEITNGETTTDADGNYEITFLAQPDESVDKKGLPIFKYEVTADVTDINGETRSATTIVNVGYHALTANIEVNNKLDKTNKDNTLSIDTKNLNGEFVPAKGTVKIYKLQGPDYVLRPRPWAAPDYKSFSKEEFKILFPNDAYTNEHNSENWKKGILVLDAKFNTEKSKEISLKNIKKWDSGDYIIELETKDKFGQKVKDQAKTTLYSDKDKTLADKQLFSITTDKNEYQPNDKVVLTIASAAKDITILVDIEKDHKVVDSYSITLNNNKKTITIPVTKEDVGGFAVVYSLVAFNSFQGNVLNINVPHAKTNLDIETITFRDKLQPGTDETWKFKIKGPNGDKVSAELLASMYDASLDQFKSHNWQFNPIYHSSYRSYFNRNAYRCFTITNFNVKRNNNYKYYPPQQQYDEFNWFGLSMNSDRWAYSRYLNNLKSKRETLASVTHQRKTYDKIITGFISDENGLPMPGVNIIIKGTTFGTQTDFDGVYNIKVKNSDELIFGSIGYHSRNLKINSSSGYSLSLEVNKDSLDEVVITALGIKRKESIITSSNQNVKAEVITQAANPNVVETLSGKVSGLQINSSNDGVDSSSKVTLRGNSSITGNTKALVVIDGKISTLAILNELAPDSVLSVNVLKGSEASALYGEAGKDGVIIVITKNNSNADFSNVKIRKNLQETAFFFPQLETDKNGNVAFSFTTPEALTQWKLQLLAHTKTLESTVATYNTVTQKELMVLPNAPRFLREGDQIKISTKIANLTKKDLAGVAVLQLFDAVTGEPIDQKFSNAYNDLGFNVSAKGNTEVTWNINVSDGVQAVQYKIIAKSGSFSDGEQNAMPVLTNRMLVTETLPMWIKSNEIKTFTLDKLKNNTSTTLKNHKLTLEMTSNPAWYAVQALPYLMEYPYECNEQTFSRYYANALASHIANSNPRIQEVFNQWKNTDALLSNLEKNQELKSILIQETPWLRDAQSETEQKKRIALLFDLNKMNNELASAKRKLESNQMANGAWSWFSNKRANRYITQHIITGFGHLKQLKVANDDNSKMIEKAIKYLDAEFVKEYKDLSKYTSDVDYSQDHLSYTQLHYLYMRSFFKDIKTSKEVEKITKYYLSQIKNYWSKRPLYAKGMMALITHRNNDSSTSTKILKSLKENSITSEELGMYWKANTNSWHWYQAPIETQALLIEAFSEIENDTETIDNLKIWLLKNKQTNRWKTTKATTEAVYALLLQGSDWLSVTEMVDVVLGGKQIEPSKLEAVKVEAGTGYYKTAWNGKDIKPEMADVKITKKGKGIAWGSLYWQYFEDLDKITSAETPLKLKKKLFKKTNGDKGEILTGITKDTQLKVGDLVRVRIELRSDRTMEFVHMKDMRAAGLEPINVLSQYKYQDGLGYYEATKDASTNFFFDYLPKGIYVFEYDLRVNNAGNMSNGITTIQSMYAPEFSSHSEGTRITVK